MKRKNKNKGKPYRAPKLAEYGDVYSLTQAKGGGANDGGGAKPNTKAGGGHGT